VKWVDEIRHRANSSGAAPTKANPTGPDLYLANPAAATSLAGARMRAVAGLTAERRAAWEAGGPIAPPEPSR